MSEILLFNELYGTRVLQWSALHLASFFSSDTHLVPNKNVFKILVAVHLEAGTTQDSLYNYSLKPFVKQLCTVVLFCSVSL